MLWTGPNATVGTLHASVYQMKRRYAALAGRVRAWRQLTGRKRQGLSAPRPCAPSAVVPSAVTITVALTSGAVAIPVAITRAAGGIRAIAVASTIAWARDQASWSLRAPVRASRAVARAALLDLV